MSEIYTVKENAPLLNNDCLYKVIATSDSYISAHYKLLKYIRSADEQIFHSKYNYSESWWCEWVKSLCVRDSLIGNKNNLYVDDLFYLLVVFVLVFCVCLLFLFANQVWLFGNFRYEMS